MRVDFFGMTEELFTELCTLLDAIEMALNDNDDDPTLAILLARDKVQQRFEIMKRHGLTVEFGGLASGTMQ